MGTKKRATREACAPAPLPAPPEGTPVTDESQDVTRDIPVTDSPITSTSPAETAPAADAAPSPDVTLSVPTPRLADSLETLGRAGRQYSTSIERVIGPIVRGLAPFVRLLEKVNAYVARQDMLRELAGVEARLRTLWVELEPPRRAMRRTSWRETRLGHFQVMIHMRRLDVDTLERRYAGLLARAVDYRADALQLLRERRALRSEVERLIVVEGKLREKVEAHQAAREEGGHGRHAASTALRQIVHNEWNAWKDGSDWLNTPSTVKFVTKLVNRHPDYLAVVNFRTLETWCTEFNKEAIAKKAKQARRAK